MQQKGVNFNMLNLQNSPTKCCCFIYTLFFFSLSIFFGYSFTFVGCSAQQCAYTDTDTYAHALEKRKLEQISISHSVFAPPHQTQWMRWIYGNVNFSSLFLLSWMKFVSGSIEIVSRSNWGLSDGMRVCLCEYVCCTEILYINAWRNDDDDDVSAKKKQYRKWISSKAPSYILSDTIHINYGQCLLCHRRLCSCDGGGWEDGGGGSDGDGGCCCCSNKRNIK